MFYIKANWPFLHYVLLCVLPFSWPSDSEEFHLAPMGAKTEHYLRLSTNVVERTLTKQQRFNFQWSVSQ